MKPLRILLTVDPEIPVPPRLYGGIERIANALANELRRLGHTVGLVAHRESTAQVDFFRGWPGRSSLSKADTVKNIGALLEAARAFRPDVVHSFSRLVYLLPLLPSRLPKIMSYQRPTGGKRNTIAAKLGRGSLVFTACSEHIAKAGRPWGGTWRPVHNFVDVDFYRYSPAVATDAPLVFLSRIERIKGVHEAIRIARAAERRLVIAGNRDSTAEGQRYWREEVEPYLEAGRVEYVGAVDDDQKNTLLGSAAALLVPIQWDEPFGIVFAEALACGTPVISCARGALPEIVEHGVHGFLVDGVEEGARAVRTLGSVDRAACRAAAERRFSSAAAAGAYLAIYRELHERARAAA